MAGLEQLAHTSFRFAVSFILGLFCLTMSSCLFPPPQPAENYVGPPEKSTTAEAEQRATGVEMEVDQFIPETEPLIRIDSEPVESPLEITLADAILLGLANNYEFQLERFNPLIQRTFEDEARAQFDPVLRVDGGVGRERTKSDKTTKGFDVSAGISTFLPTGTTIDLQIRADQEKDSILTTNLDDEYSAGLDLTITQAILRGAGLDVNLATLRQARLDTKASEYELRGLAEALTAKIEDTYWDYLLAQEEVKIYAKSLDLARRLIKETYERIELGDLARTEVYFAEAEAAVREQNLINAKSRVEKTRLQLLQLLNPPGKSLWNRQVKLLTRAVTVPPKIEDLAAHLEVARQMRPDLNQSRLAVQRGELEVVKTKNGLLPRLDLFIILGRTGYSRSFERAVRDISSGDGGLDFFAGLTFEYPIFNRSPKARHERSNLDLLQEKEALRNLTQLVEQDVLSSFVEINRARDQIKASSVSRKYQQEKLQAEMDRYAMGESTMFRVAQAERDLVISQVSEVQARISYIKALTQFYFSEGTLLVRRGIDAPGENPVEMNEEDLQY